MVMQGLSVAFHSSSYQRLLLVVKLVMQIMRHAFSYICVTRLTFLNIYTKEAPNLKPDIARSSELCKRKVNYAPVTCLVCTFSLSNNFFLDVFC